MAKQLATGESAVLRIFNTLTRAKEEFQPLNPPRVTFYNCGPTVYDYFHIGNARNFILADLIRRYLRFRGYEVKFVQNITDIDDKIIRRANEEGLSIAEVAGKYTRAYLEHIQALGVEPADVIPRATEHIPRMIAFIQRLIDQGFAYVSEGDVYFSVGRFAEYGKLSRRNLDEQREGERVAVDPRKRDPKDFDLWKAAKPGEPTWDSPWGPGRPGWHVECSVMSSAHLGETIDIHSGGSDLQFPHHENEIAQSEAATGKPFVRYWIHNAFLNIEGEKMSKSLGNFVTIDQVLARYDPMAVRYFFLSAHYRSPMDYGRDSLEEATSALNRLADSVITLEKVIELLAPGESGGAAEPVRGEEKLKAMRESFLEFMDDDFNTPRALSVLFEAVRDLHENRRRIEGLKEERDQFLSYIRAVVAQIRELTGVLGLKLPPADSGLDNVSAASLLDVLSETFRRMLDAGGVEATGLAAQLIVRMELVGYRPDRSTATPRWTRATGPAESNVNARQLLEAAIAARNNARAAKHFEIGDFIRNELNRLGIILEDYRSGTIWKRQ